MEFSSPVCIILTGLEIRNSLENKMIKSSIEQLLDMSLDKLEAMTEVELDTYFAEALKVCPPIKMFGGGGGGTTSPKSAASKLLPRSSLADQMLNGMSPEKQKLAKMAAALGVNIESLGKIK